MIGMVVMGHGTFASGIKSTIELVLGEQSNLRYVDFLDGQTPANVESSLRSAIDDLESGSGVVVFADLAGGTPFNVAVMIGSEKSGSEVRVVGGVNIPMIFQGVESSEDGDLDAMVAESVAVGKEAMVAFSSSDNTVSTSSGEDGI